MNWGGKASVGSRVCQVRPVLGCVMVIGPSVIRNKGIERYSCLDIIGFNHM